MNTSTPCLILEWSEADQWPGLHGRLRNGIGTCPLQVPLARRPAVLQPDRPTAEAEAKRLAMANPGKRFAIFEASLVGMTVDVPSHITVGGKVWLTRKVAHLVEIDDSESPF